jgi:thiamine-phosphate pyrophosphorylase
MDDRTSAVVDANLNRAAEGLRTIEDYCRFVAGHREWSARLSQMRHHIDAALPFDPQWLQQRDTQRDARAHELPIPRPDLSVLLTANFKRVGQALRVLEEYTGNPTFNRCRYALYALEKEVVLHSQKPAIRPGVYLISDDSEILKQGLAWQVSLIQLRDKSGDKASILEKAKTIAPLAKAVGVPFVMNDFADIALLVDADGLHTGQDDLPVSELRKLLGAHRLLGRTTHTFAQGKTAMEDGADYVSVGPIWETPSKPGRAAIGFDYLRRAGELGVPFVAIGGVNLETLNDILPFRPPMIGLVRDYENIPVIQARLARND